MNVSNIMEGALKNASMMFLGTSVPVEMGISLVQIRKHALVCTHDNITCF